MFVCKLIGDVGLFVNLFVCEFIIDEFVCVVEIIVCNVCLYQDCGLIDLFEWCGCVGIYMQVYLGWFKFINYLFGCGYMFFNIQELFKVIVEGYDLCFIFGLEFVIVSLWLDELFKYYLFFVFVKLFGCVMLCQVLVWVILFGLFEFDGFGYLVCSLKVLLVGVQMVKVGFLFVEVFDIIECVWLYMQVVVDDFVLMVVCEFDKYGSDLLLVEDVLCLVDVIWCICLLVLVVVEVELMCVFEMVVNKYLGDCVVQVIEYMYELLGSMFGLDKGQCFWCVYVWGVFYLFLV